MIAFKSFIKVFQVLRVKHAQYAFNNSSADFMPVIVFRIILVLHHKIVINVRWIH
jgi:hypothetical protein